MVEDGELDQGWMNGLPDRPSDGDFHGVKDYLYYDFDALHLYGVGADGVEDPGSAVFQAEGFVNLQPRDWFEPFVK